MTPSLNPQNKSNHTRHSSTALEYFPNLIPHPLISVLFTVHRYTEKMLTRIHTHHLKQATLQHFCKVDHDPLNRSPRLLANYVKVAPNIQVLPDNGDVKVLMRREAAIW